MKSYLLVMASLGLFFTGLSHAGKTLYEIRADGLACPYCAYGIEKKFKAIKGVDEVDVALKEGVVKVTAAADVNFNDKQLSTLFNDAGFTYKGINKKTELK